nr:ArgP/LysG family DNA-binding transcriptional regulator [Geodermatophilaceae bacterium]
PVEGGPPRMASLSVAVNADSLATWVLPALVPLAEQFRLDLHREDQDHTSALLRDGVVMAAVTSQAQPLPGCSSTLLGAMRYRPMASPRFLARWFPRGVGAAALHRAPVVVFDRKDDLQHAYLRRRTHGRADPPSHHVPSSADFCTAIRLGVGWGMLPDLQSREPETAGELMDIDPGHGVDVVLYWQQWRLQSTTLDRLAAAVAQAATVHLIQPPSG